MKSFNRVSFLLVAVLWSATLPADAQVNVTQEHNNPSRDGVYIDAAFTPSAAANLTRDLGFDGTIVGNVYAQPLYIEGGPNGAMVIAVTESNNVYALNATTGTVMWQRNLGPPVPLSELFCGNINPVGITGTPVVDLASRSLFFDALIDGATKKHFIYSLNVDTGATNSGWPVDVNATATYNGMTFTSLVQEERGGLALVNGIVYMAYSGYNGDCGMYHGWVVGVPINNPSNVHAWATTAIGGGIWGHGGIASPVAQANVSGTVNRGTSAVTYHTSQGTYFAFHNDGNAVSAYRVTATNPPAIVSGWSVGQSGRGSPWVTTTDGTNNVIVWVAGVGGDQRLHGYNGDTGAVIYAGGGNNELMTGTRQWNTGIAARGRIYFAADNKVYAFKVPTPPQ